MSFSFITKKVVLWNPTPFTIKMKYDGTTHELAPFKELETTNETFVNIMLQDYAEVGLVCLREDEIINGDFDAYRAKKELEGLNRILAFKEDKLGLEVNYVQGMKMKTNIDVSSIPNNISLFERDIKHIQKIIAESSKEYAEVLEVAEALPERPVYKSVKKNKINDKKDAINDILDKN